MSRQKQQGQRVFFYTGAGFVRELIEAQDEHLLPRLLKAALKQNLIVPDELSYIPISTLGARLLLQFCSSLSECAAPIIATNSKSAHWTKAFSDELMTTALLDRLTHRAHILEFTGESFQFRQRPQRKAWNKDQ